MSNKTKGFTLIELIITLALIGMVIQATYSLLFAGNNSFVVSTNKGFTQQEARLLGDIVNSELKYITNMTTDLASVEEHFTGSYYSLEYLADDVKPVLLRKYYEDTGTGYVISEKRYPSASVPYKSFKITNHEAGTVNVLIEHQLSKGKLTTNYNLPFNIILSNNKSLLTAVDVELISAGSLLYYTKADDELFGKRIDIIEVPPVEEEDDDDDDNNEDNSDGDEEVAPPAVTIQVLAGEVIKIDSNNNPGVIETYSIKKGNQGGSRISIQLKSYNDDMHKGKVTVTVTPTGGTINDSQIMTEQHGYDKVIFTLKASSNGSGAKVSVELIVQTDTINGVETHNRPYKFETN